ncbi:hypothetical protein [Kribbella sp. NPDC051137]|uniref:hypothetical protein n=1 Tax=Kribbella sp. NPDC051137 TaxID=3155045 RepID=UPI003444E4A2
MERVLLDGTTLMSGTRLLAGEDPPTALNVYSLSLLVESLILHSELIVLDTLPDDDRLTRAAAIFGDAVCVERRSAEDIVERYDVLNELSATNPRRVMAELYELLTKGTRRAPGREPELDNYLNMLDAAHREQVGRGWTGRKTENVPGRSRIPDRRDPRPSQRNQPLVDVEAGVRIFDKSELRELTAAGSTATALSGFADRHRRFRNSYWNAAQHSHQTYLTRFTPALLMRTHFYLLASEVFAAPYRPDILRAPICWKFFGRGPFADLTIGERMVDLADASARARVESANQLIGKPALTALPVFLGRVLASSTKPTDVVARAMQIRESRDAKRFRKAMARLAAAQETGDVSTLVREAARYSDLLRREYAGAPGGAGTADLLWSLAADGTQASLDPTAASFVSLGASVGKTAVRAPDLLRRWSYGRKIALIGRTIRAANKAKAMQSELKRLFGAEVTAGDLEFLEKVDRLGFN